MKFYKDPANTVFAYEADGSQDAIIPADQIQITQAEADALRFPPQPVDLEAEVAAAVQNRLDSFARTRNYDGILSACTYASSAVSQFAAEGQYCVSARDASWGKCYDILAAVKAGTQPMPASVDEVLAQLPALAWPQ